MEKFKFLQRQTKKRITDITFTGDDLSYLRSSLERNGVDLSFMELYPQVIKTITNSIYGIISPTNNENNIS